MVKKFSECYTSKPFFSPYSPADIPSGFISEKFPYKAIVEIVRKATSEIRKHHVPSIHLAKGKLEYSFCIREDFRVFIIGKKEIYRGGDKVIKIGLKVNITAAKIKDVACLEIQGTAWIEEQTQYNFLCRKQFPGIVKNLHIQRFGKTLGGFIFQPLCCEGDVFSNFGILSCWTPRNKISLFQQMLAPLEALHRSGRVHLDIKGENFLMKGDKVFLCDCSSLTTFGSHQIGKTTPAYIPPEVFPLIFFPKTAEPKARLQDMVSPTWDIWSLGVLFYRIIKETMPKISLLMEQHPLATFKINSLSKLGKEEAYNQLLVEIQDDISRDLRNVRKEFWDVDESLQVPPQHVEELIALMLHVHPQKRPSSAALIAILNDLAEKSEQEINAFFYDKEEAD